MLVAVTVFQGVIRRGKDAGSMPGNKRRISVLSSNVHSTGALPIPIWQGVQELWLVTCRSVVSSLVRLMER